MREHNRINIPHEIDAKIQQIEFNDKEKGKMCHDKVGPSQECKVSLTQENKSMHFNK